MKRVTFAIVVLSAFMVVSLVWADGDEFIRTISVTGNGKASVAPDVATIFAGVVTESSTAKEALAANNKAMSQVLETLKPFKIPKKDVQTANFNVVPQYRKDAQGRRLPQIIGYQVMNQIRVKVRNLDDLGKVLDSLIRSGSNQVSGVGFGVGDPANILKLARERAVADARMRAELYAQAAGVRVGKVLTISEQPVVRPQPQMLRHSISMERVADVPVERGEQEFNARIHVTFAIAGKE